MIRPRGGLTLSLLVVVLVGGLSLAGPNAARSPLALQPTAAPTAQPSPIAVAARSTPLPAVASVTPVPSPTARPTAAATATPRPSPTPDPGVRIGTSSLGLPLVAYRFGQGPLKVVLVGDIHGGYEENTYRLARQLLAYFRAHAADVPQSVSLWIIPTLNPDGLVSDTRTNGAGVDLNRNADTDLDGCAGNDWAPDTFDSDGRHAGSGGAYPFSESESRAVRDFLADAWVAVFFHSASEAIYTDTCGRHLPTARLAAVMSAGSGYPVPAGGWPGYPITGDFGDYLAGEGVAAVTVELTDHDEPEFERNLSGVRALLGAVDDVLTAEAAAVGADYQWLSDAHRPNLGVWRFDEGTFIHPQALEVIASTAYLLDGGRVLALDLDEPGPPRLLLRAGDDIPRSVGSPVRVLELLDLAADGDGLLALDRAGDVYRYDLSAGAWRVERYDRPPGNTYDHYFVALSASDGGRFLLETSHEKVWRFAGQNRGAAWASVPRGRDVDLSASGADVYVLTRGLENPAGALRRFRQESPVSAFQPDVALVQPRQVHATTDAVWVLDRAGRRLLALDPVDGGLRTLYQFTDRRAVGAIWAGADGQLLLAGRDVLYFFGQPERQARIAGGGGQAGEAAAGVTYDPDLLDRLRGLLMPIEGARITSRDFQMPGAPRHYRLGVHEGMDFYGYAVGVRVDRGTPVHAVADGVVIRADHDYVPLTRAQADAWAAECRRLGYTPPQVLDGYRGRQVWIEHDGGLVSRYVHLGAIAPGIDVGTAVTRGQTIATVGNSGTPDGLAGPNADLHLHLELWLGDGYVGQFMRPLETREWLERILR